MNGTAPLRPLYAFMILMGENLTFYSILPHLFYDICDLSTESFSGHLEFFVTSEMEGHKHKNYVAIIIIIIIIIIIVNPLLLDCCFILGEQRNRYHENPSQICRSLCRELKAGTYRI
jgi:small-conductance mechanosensitive channel